MAVNLPPQYHDAEAEYKKTGAASALLANETFTRREKFEMLPRVVPGRW